MSNSEGISLKAKKNKSDNFVWSEDILDLFRAIPCIFVKKTRVGLR